jgi:hypothetical protein
MAFVSVTRLRLRSGRYVLPLTWQTLLAFIQAKRTPGNRGVRLLRDANRAFWTATAWDDEASMRAFMMAGSHRRVMSKVQEWCDESAVVHWAQDQALLPDWKEAHRRMATEGRPTRLRHPSANHHAFHIAEPQIRRSSTR